MKISDTTPFLKQPLFYQPLPYYGKNMTPLFWKISKTQVPHPPYRGRVQTMSTLHG